MALKSSAGYLLLAVLFTVAGAVIIYNFYHLSIIPDEDWYQLHVLSKPVSTHGYTFHVGDVSEETANFSFWSGIGFIVAGCVLVVLAWLSRNVE